MHPHHSNNNAVLTVHMRASFGEVESPLPDVLVAMHMLGVLKTRMSLFAKKSLESLLIPSVSLSGYVDLP